MAYFMVLVYLLVAVRIWQIAGPKRLLVLLDTTFLVACAIIDTAATIDPLHRHRPLYIVMLSVLAVIVVAKSVIHVRTIRAGKV